MHDAGWLTPSAFAPAVAFSYITPGPVLIIATFVGFQVAGVLGALASTLGAFIAPWALAGVAAQEVTRFSESRWLRAFGSGAAPAVVGVLGATVISLGREAVSSWPLAMTVAVVFVAARWTPVHPIALLALGGLVGYLVGR